MAVIATVQRLVACPFSVLRLLSFCNIEQQSIDLFVRGVLSSATPIHDFKITHSPDKHYVAASCRVSRFTSRLVVSNKEEICPDCGSSLFH